MLTDWMVWTPRWMEMTWSETKPFPGSLLNLSPKWKKKNCFLRVKSLKFEFSLKVFKRSFYWPHQVSSSHKLTVEILFGAKLCMDQGCSTEIICENWVVSNKTMMKKVLWISTSEAGRGRFCYCMFSNVAMWNVKLFLGLWMQPSQNLDH